MMRVGILVDRDQEPGVFQNIIFKICIKAKIVTEIGQSGIAGRHGIDINSAQVSIFRIYSGGNCCIQGLFSHFADLIIGDIYHSQVQDDDA